MKDQKTPEEIKAKTLLDCKDEVARKYEFESWLQAVRVYKNSGWRVTESVILSMENEAMQEYAQTISEGKDREIEVLKNKLEAIGKVLDSKCVTGCFPTSNEMKIAEILSTREYCMSKEKCKWPDCYCKYM